MNVTKTMAESIVEKLIQPMKNNLKAETENLKEYVTLIALSQIPTSIQKDFKEHPEYFRGNGATHLTTGAEILHYCYVDYTKVPLRSNNNYNCNTDQFAFVAKSRKNIDKLKGEIAQPKESIISILLALKNTKRITESFPEAAPYVKGHEDKKSTPYLCRLVKFAKR